MTYDLSGKVALVTGAASKRGIGFATARRLAQEGADVAVVGILPKHPWASEDDEFDGWRGLDSAVEEFQALGRRGLAIVADITQSRQIEAIVEKTVDKFGKIDILVNNAGILPPMVPVLEHDEEVWRRVMDVNLFGPFLICKAVGKVMVDGGQGGKIVNISSRSGKVGAQYGLSAYCASKAGLISLTQTLALELAPHKINVNAVCPGGTATELSRGRPIRSTARRLGISIEEATEKVYAESLPTIPLGKVSQPEDQADAVAFLVSKEADHITGVALNISGGVLMAP